MKDTMLTMESAGQTQQMDSGRSVQTHIAIIVWIYRGAYTVLMATIKTSIANLAISTVAHHVMVQQIVSIVLTISILTQLPLLAHLVWFLTAINV